MIGTGACFRWCGRLGTWPTAGEEYGFRGRVRLLTGNGKEED